MQNVFEFLGLPANHRKKDKVVQLVKHYNEVPESKKKWPMYGQVKKDGVYTMLVITANKNGMFSRTGKRYTNVDYLEYNGMDDVRPGIYIAELCNDECSLETLSGMVNPNRVKPLSAEQEELMDSCYLAFHDRIGLEGFITGAYDVPYNIRHKLLSMLLPDHLVLPIYFIEGKATFDTYVEQCIAEGEEGAVIKQMEEGWYAGHKGYRVMKKVRGVDYDLRCIGAEEGTGKYKGKVANLFFKWKNGKEIKCMLGKGWTHDDAEAMWLADTQYPYSTARSPVGKIFQVYALQESSKGKLRLPKVGELRFDKTTTDV